MNTKGKIMRKLLGQPVASSTANDNPETASNIGSPKLRPSASQQTIYSAGAPLSCLDRSPDGQRAVIAGAKTFKILKVDGSTITEDIDLRAVISSYAASHDLSAATPDQLNIRAVQWSHGTLDSNIVTASGNGRITIYDLNRAGEGLEVARIQEHTRQVHKLAINPYKNSWLLSASQDGTVKSFDIRAPIPGRHGPTMKSLQTYKCNAEAVRDVKWSPTDGYEFACCTDTGAVLKWDSRKPSAPVLRLSAHPTSCSSISWHPDGVHLISGGIDLLCHVWDVSGKADRNQKQKFTIATPAPVSRVSWRPACWSATAQGKRAAQVTVAYDDSNTSRNQNSSVHIWDLARPALPFKEIEQWDSAPTGLLWNSRDILWSVDKAGRFIQTDVAFVPQLIDRRSLSEFAVSPTGDVLMLLEERQLPRRSRPSITTPEASPGFPHNGSGPLLSVSRSDSEEDVVGSFLGPRQPKGYRRRNSARSVHSMSTTPPSVTGMSDNKVMSLEEAVKVTGPYKPQQIMAIGHAPSTAKRATYKYFSNRYLMRLSRDSVVPMSEQPMNARIASITQAYARAAEDVRHYRLAQTWRLLGYTMNLLLTRRAEHHRNCRLTSKVPEPKEPKEQQVEAEEDTLESESKPTTEKGQETPRRLTRPHTPLESPTFRNYPRAVHEFGESTSNVATPLVRPVRDTIAQETREAMHTPMITDDDELRLPGPVHSPAPIPISGTKKSPDTASSVEGYDFYGMESFSPSLEYVAPPRKQPLRLEYKERRVPRAPPRMEPQRHDSGESFQMFSSSADSHPGKFLESSGSDGHSETKEQSRSLRDKVSSWENSLPPDRRHRPSVDSDAPAMSDISEGLHTPESGRGVGRAFHKSMPRNPSSPPVFRIQEGSALMNAKVTPTSTRFHEEPISPTSHAKVSEDPNIIESDFLPWSNDPDFLIRPIDPTVLVQRSINFEAQTGVLNAAAMVLLLRPLLPPDAVDDIQAAAIVRQYHHRLNSFKLFTEAASLRNLCVPTYPAVFGPAQEKVTTGFFCTDCHKPIENDPLIPGSMWKCTRCRQNVAPCAVCLHRELPPNIDYSEQGITSYSSVWWLCSGCGHGGHTSCMQAWHAGPEFEEGDINSDGCCPLEGCLHPCLPGKWRDTKAEEKRIARAKEMDSLVRENSRRGGRNSVGVRRDQREVNQSKAVEGVRVALGVSNLTSGSSGGLERKKSVKLIAPGEEA
jgi:WD40 repeat protein